MNYTDEHQQSDTNFLLGVNYGRSNQRERIAQAIEAQLTQFALLTDTPLAHPICQAYADAARIARGSSVSR